MSEDSRKFIAPPSPRAHKRTGKNIGAAPALSALECPAMTIEYIAELTEQLAQLASSINEDSIAYFLSMARAEAELVALSKTPKAFRT